MQKNICLIGLDLDNTVLNSKKEVTPRVRAAIDKAIESGIHVLPATGRMLGGIPENIMQIPGVRYAVTSNGAKVFDLKTGKELYSNCFSKETSLEILKESRQFDAMVSTFLDGVAYSDVFNPAELARYFSPESIEYLMKCRTQVENMGEIIAASSATPEKMTLTFTDLALREQAWRLFADRTDCCVTASSDYNVELNTPTANKGVALLALGKHLGYGKEAVMAMGDGLNDFEMLRQVGFGVAMGDAPPEVIEVADEVTLTADEDGVALAIEKLFV